MRTDEEYKISERRIEICKILKEFCDTKDCIPNQNTMCLKCHHIATALINAGYRTQIATLKDFVKYLKAKYRELEQDRLRLAKLNLNGKAEYCQGMADELDGCVEFIDAYLKEFLREQNNGH